MMSVEFQTYIVDNEHMIDLSLRKLLILKKAVKSVNDKEKESAIDTIIEKYKSREIVLRWQGDKLQYLDVNKE
jgi:hypothetical protein